MVTCLPQILVGSSTWPDSRAKLAARRNVFTATLVRGAVHMMVGRGVMKEPGDCLVVMEAIFRILVEQSHVRWAQAHHHPEVDGVLQVTGGHAGQVGYESV